MLGKVADPRVRRAHQLCSDTIMATTAWMQEVERSRMPEPKAPPTNRPEPNRGRRFSGERCSISAYSVRAAHPT
ncbi:hypothetical protein SAMN05216575_1011027 [Ectopseudomonas alcaliphila]|uniref:Uncharacterized protein n=1 Tax=Ectopseudomonas alcaliphila TaxID=101564 RepID=A0A1G6WJH1_9GAMM|nr:hypothetical protein SAMN05216575_1011027 [Pseudomonas alcaliphila]